MTDFTCFKCSAIIIFDKDHVGKNGKKIPLDPATHQPHDCPMREKRFDKNSEAEQADDGIDRRSFDEVASTVAEGGLKYVDHTAKAQQRFKAFSSNSAEGLTKAADEWIDENEEFMRVKLIGQLQLDNGTFAIALYYEEVAKQ